ncbi:MAG: ATP-dependent DNA ligase [Candidatus Dojkabacteria bacterium]|nr:ATP-dependent DNA ligase [Candidatus Dojkabacteria bacterium]
MLNLFIETVKKLEITSSTKEKTETIANALKQINIDEELLLFSRYLCGIIYPAYSPKKINLGTKLIVQAIIKAYKLDKETFQEFFKGSEDISECISKIYTQYKSSVRKSIIFSDRSIPESLKDIQILFDDISNISSNIKKVNYIIDLIFCLPLDILLTVIKILTNTLRVGIKEAIVEKAISVAFNKNIQIIRKAMFYTGDIGEVAVHAKNNKIESIKFKLFHPIKVMLASSEENIDEIFERMEKDIWCEYKYDGIRAHIHKEDDRVEIYTRDLKNITDQFPEIVFFLKKIEQSDFLLDGEIVPFQNNKIMQFSLLQKRLGRKEKIDIAARENPCTFIAYDIIYDDGKLVTDLPLHKRRALLENKFSSSGLLFSKYKIVNTKEEFIDFFKKSKEEGREGLMIKKIDSIYESGKRGINWIKYKETLDPLDVVIVKAEQGEGKNAKYLSQYTFAVWDEKKQNLLEIGKVYSGATEELLEELTKKLQEYAVKELENGYEVKPIIILEVAFENIQISNRYNGGYAVRFPRIIRERTGDKSLDEINTIEDVKKLYLKLQKEAN